MNKKILDEINIYMGIDTLQVKSDSKSPLTKEQVPYIHNIICLDSDSDTYSYRLNADKANNDLQIYNYNIYEKVCNSMIEELELTNPAKTRIDFRIDSFDNNFTELLKLNKLLILLLEQTYKLKNRYQSTDPLTLDDLCVRVQNSRLEVENYNKGIEEPTGNVMNRLEFRSKHLTDENLDKEYTEFEKWCARLEKAVTKEKYKALQDKQNEILVLKYGQEKDKGVTVNEFLYKYQGNIWTSKQLCEFYHSLGYKDFEQQAKLYKRKKKIEYFSFGDLRYYVNKIVKCGTEYFAT